jgi:hypothetical protein
METEMGLSSAEKQKQYRERQRQAALEKELRFRRAVMEEIARTFRVVDAQPLLAFFRTLSPDQKAIFLGTVMAEEIEPRDIHLSCGDDTYFGVEPRAWVKDGRLAFGADLSAGPGA